MPAIRLFKCGAASRFTVTALALASILASHFGAARTASADGCDITSDSCETFDSIATLRADIDNFVPSRWQRSFDVRLDLIESRTQSLASGDNVDDLFAVMMAYQKMVDAEARQDRAGSRHDWGIAFLPVLTEDVAAVRADICAVVGCLQTEE